MSEMKTTPVFKCRRCGKPLVVTHLSTTTPDYKGEALSGLMKALPDIALCEHCKNTYNWLAAQGRSDEFDAGQGILIAHRGRP
jgi:hypothetical protein